MNKTYISILPKLCSGVHRLDYRGKADLPSAESRGQAHRPLLRHKAYPKALILGAMLLKELKKLDDKYLLVDLKFYAIFYFSIVLINDFPRTNCSSPRRVSRVGQPAESQGRPNLC